MANILVTGGAGFIGSHLVAALLQNGHRVRVIDSFVEQVHREQRCRLSSDVELIRGDVRNKALLERALAGIEVIFHDAAEVGVGQSMYEMERYVSANTLGTTILLEALSAHRAQIRKLIVASSMSIYGEGEYRCRDCGIVAPPLRSVEQLEMKEWEVQCPHCTNILAPTPTSETKPLNPASVYAITKQDQEQLCLVVGRAYGIPTVALRYFNVYGPYQALSNPYTGVAAIFSGRLLNREAPVIFEDGLQSRDFTHVSDIVQANLLAMESETANFQAINVGTGQATSVKQMAQMLAKGLGLELEPEIVGSFRAGDIRHCVADITRAQVLLGYQPTVLLEEGIHQLLDWVCEQQSTDRVMRATAELHLHGLIR